MGLFSPKSRQRLRHTLADRPQVHHTPSPSDVLPSVAYHPTPSRLLDDSLLQHPLEEELCTPPPEYLAVVDEPNVSPPRPPMRNPAREESSLLSRPLPALPQPSPSEPQQYLPPIQGLNSWNPTYEGDASDLPLRTSVPSKISGHARTESNSSVGSNSSIDSVNSAATSSSMSSIETATSVDSGPSIDNQKSCSLSSMYKQVCSRFDDVLTLIDCEEYSSQDTPSSPRLPCSPTSAHTARSSSPQSPRFPLSSSVPNMTVTMGDRSMEYPPERGLRLRKRKPVRKATEAEDRLQLSSAVPSRYFHKVELYANSKLPSALPQLAVYPATWPLLCLAARCSLKVYSAPSGPERRQEVVVPADRRSGCKAMYIKSVPADAVRTIVVAVRGTATFSDWAVNLRSDPVAPTGFLADAGNACHAGFLSAARAMVRPVARALCQMLEEDPARAAYSVVFTGHSAGGAVAALLYMHMLEAASPEVDSELTALAGCFRRLHCVTFGAPPVSLLPLTKPGRPELQSSIFMSFVNEGDPVTRADKAYVKSLFSLMAASPPPISSEVSGDHGKGHKKKSSTSSARYQLSLPTWKVPPATLSNAGRIVVLRGTSRAVSGAQPRTVKDRARESVTAVTCRDDQLRGVIWGDPVCHLMRLYSTRIEALAVASATGRRP